MSTRAWAGAGAAAVAYALGWQRGRAAQEDSSMARVEHLLADAGQAQRHAHRMLRAIEAARTAATDEGHEVRQPRLRPVDMPDLRLVKTNVEYSDPDERDVDALARRMAATLMQQ